MITDPRYRRWVTYRQIRQQPLMTNTQYRFAMWLFSSDKDIVALGNMVDIFDSVRSFLKEDNKRDEDAAD